MKAAEEQQRQEHEQREGWPPFWIQELKGCGWLGTAAGRVSAAGGPAPANAFCSMEEEWIISPNCSSSFFTRVCGCSA